MPAREDTVRDFWIRLTEGRGALGGAVRFHEPAEDLLDDWKVPVREEMTAFLRDFDPDFHEFSERVMRYRRKLDDTWMLYQLGHQASTAFFRWLERRGVPTDVARKAVAIYQFDFAIRERGAG